MQDYTVKVLEESYEGRTVEFARDAEADLEILEYRLYKEAPNDEGENEIGPGSRHRNGSVTIQTFASVLNG